MSASPLFVPLDAIDGKRIEFRTGFHVSYKECTRHVFLTDLYYYESLGNGAWAFAYRLDQAKTYYNIYLGAGGLDKAYYRKVMGI